MRPFDYLALAPLVFVLTVFGVLLASVVVGPFDLGIVVPAIAIPGAVIAALVTFAGRRGGNGSGVVRGGEQGSEQHNGNDVAERRHR